MKRYIVSFLALLFVPVLATGQVRLEVSIEPASSLPLLTPSVRIVARNTGSSVEQLPTEVALRVTSSDGTSFYADAGFRDGGKEMRLPLPEGKTQLAGGESLDLTLWAAGLSEAPWFYLDNRLKIPGTYKLQLVSGLRLDLEGGHTIVTEPAPPVLRSNVVDYRVEEPSAVDALVLAHIEAMNGDRRTGDKILADWPRSRYASRFLPLWDGPRDYTNEIDVLQSAIALRPEPVVIQSLQSRIADRYVALMGKKLEALDASGAIAAADNARALYEELSREALDPSVRAAAREALSTGVLSSKEILRTVKHRVSGDTLEIVALPHCYERRASGEAFVWFGYVNGNPQSVTIPIGSRNKVTPPPFDRGQPTTFIAGLHNLAFVAKAEQNQVTWHLDGEQFHVDLKELPPCPAGAIPADRSMLR